MFVVEGRADAVVLIAVEDYATLDDVTGARKIADAWMQWFVEGRGVSASRVFKAYDADATDIKVRELARAGASAVQPGGTALVGGLQPIIPTALVGQMSARTRVLTAAGSGEFSGPLPGEARPAFSYLALGGLMGWADIDGDGDWDGRVSASELRAYVHGALNLTVDGRTQTPALLGTDADLGAAVSSRAPRLSQVKAALAEAASAARARPLYGLG